MGDQSIGSGTASVRDLVQRFQVADEAQRQAIISEARALLADGDVLGAYHDALEALVRDPQQFLVRYGGEVKQSPLSPQPPPPRACRPALVGGSLRTADGARVTWDFARQCTAENETSYVMSLRLGGNPPVELSFSTRDRAASPAERQAMDAALKRMMVAGMSDADVDFLFREVVPWLEQAQRASDERERAGLREVALATWGDHLVAQSTR
jgi:hypothetical protein